MVSGEREWTYAELDAWANRIAHQLIETGGPERRVALLLPRGPYFIAAILGVLKCGAAYVPLDPAYPQERIEFMLDDADPVVVIDDVWARRPLDGYPGSAPRSRSIRTPGCP
jgi:pristinamycin I synthase-2